MKFYTTFKISENIHETPEGYLVCVGVPVARTGEMIYGEGETPLEAGEDGKVYVTRSPEEVFRPETIASFEGKPITIQHPSEHVTPTTWKMLSNGHLQNVRRGKDDTANDLVADLLITDSIAIGLVKMGLREVSCGYEADYEQTGPGRGLQTNIVGNHLALVDEGRAGSSYAINDHKGKGTMSAKLIEKLKARFGAKVIDEAMAEEKKEAKDAFPEKGEKSEEAASKDAAAYDALLSAVKDLAGKVDALGKPAKDATKPATESAPAETVAKDETLEAGAAAGTEAAVGLEARLAKLEALVASLVGETGDADMDEEDETDDDADEDDADEDETEDAEPKGKMVGDAAATDVVSRIEILAPGLKVRGKDGKSAALKTAYGTADGKKVIDQLTGGKEPDYKNEVAVHTLFVATSELLKASRSSGLARAKAHRVADAEASDAVEGGAVLTAEQLNEINAKHYGVSK